MKNILFSVGLISLLAGMVVLSSQSPAHARKPGRAGNASGIASIAIQADSSAQVTAAAKKIFAEDSYQVYSERDDQIEFQRAGDRRTDFAYGGLGGGVWERVILNIVANGPGNFLVECNVYMLDSPDSTPSGVDTKVRKFFGRQYQRMLGRVKTQAERATPAAVVEGVKTEQK